MSFLKAGLFTGIVVLAGVGYVSCPQIPAVTFESLESKTVSGTAVFNRIGYSSEGSLDVWTMQQSHQGPSVDVPKWDRLALVVDRSTIPKTARFYQLPPGELGWSRDAREISFRVSCFNCHNNGPRAIRPVVESANFPLGWRARLQVAWWNLRMKSYGRVKLASEEDRRDALRSASDVPLRHLGSFDVAPLRLKACTECHNEEPGGRGELSRQQAGTIDFLVGRGLMPPESKLTPHEKNILMHFLRGFSGEGS